MALFGTPEHVATLHLTKVAFACRDLAALQERIRRRAEGGEVRVATRMRPKRSGELVGGNLYWIVRHRIVAALEIRRFEDREDGRIDIVCSAELKTVAPMPRRAHQGWRYLEEAEAPSADGDGSGIAELPPQLYGRLAALALV
ncbi:MAG: DUF1489 family protein [Sphingomicrobium sp.]